MKISIAVTVIAILPLLSCSQQLVASPQTEVKATQSGHVHDSVNSNAVTVKPNVALTQYETEQKNATLNQSDIDRQINFDKQMIRTGQEPPEVLKYDLEIVKMMPEAKAILAAHDKARARIWQSKYRAIVEARNKAVEDFLAPSTAMNNAIANVLESSRLSRGSGVGQQQHNPNETFACGSGPGPGQRQVGEAAGGNGVASTPICSWN
ncbi:hypothetical protein [Paraburkholderia sp. BCC1876]|uniref:hypothetical protein n=1 Tax=Paraburkholderia sp. BCC1876 TaxID=2676303 RepID=UPI0015928DF1|nr:hypothetical protein [Paraburkholderia sp. BCC1876]